MRKILFGLGLLAAVVSPFMMKTAGGEAPSPAAAAEPRLEGATVRISSGLVLASR